MRISLDMRMHIIMSTLDPENPSENEPLFSDYYTYSNNSWGTNENTFNDLESDTLNLMVQKDGHYYENVFKYNHFHAGWDDASELEILESGTDCTNTNEDNTNRYVDVADENLILDTYY